MRKIFTVAVLVGICASQTQSLNAQETDAVQNAIDAIISPSLQKANIEVGLTRESIRLKVKILDAQIKYVIKSASAGMTARKLNASDVTVEGLVRVEHSNGAIQICLVKMSDQPYGSSSYTYGTKILTAVRPIYFKCPSVKSNSDA